MSTTDPIILGKAEEFVTLLPQLANRHGLIAGATGTGKTVTLQVMAEQFSQRGVPVFMADVKGDLSGISQPGGGKPKLEERATELGIELTYSASPVIFWDVFGEQGHRLRATISEMGPLLLARLLELNETQEGVLNIAFKIADDEGLLLLDLKDLRSMLQFVADNAETIKTEYGLVSSASIGAIQRQLLVLEQQGAERFFAEPALELSDIMRVSPTGKGYISILAADKLMQSPRLYATFLLWLLSELFEQLPEVGDLPQPKLVFFFDEAHLLFTDAPKALIQKVEQVVRLIRSKGVGVYFVTQNPLDVPETVLAQLSNKAQHALRAFTPRDQKAVKSAAETFRQNPAFDSTEAILELGVGEALVSTLDPKGTPNIVQRTKIRPPMSRLGPATPEERQMVRNTSPVGAHYDREIDRESAYEILTKAAQSTAQAQAEAEAQARAQAQQEAAEKASRQQEPAGGGLLGGLLGGGGRREGIVESVVKSTVRAAGSSVGRQIGNQLVRGLLGGLLGGSGGGRRRR
ncbi:MAG: DUF853 domain-containing protein [Fimbriimonadaceae bacterium]|nr:DUF853 domain-containing protein [Fimbriimonadaceae bacterium]